MQDIMGVSLRVHTRWGVGGWAGSGGGEDKGAGLAEEKGVPLCSQKVPAYPLGLRTLKLGNEDGSAYLSSSGHQTPAGPGGIRESRLRKLLLQPGATGEWVDS